MSSEYITKNLFKFQIETALAVDALNHLDKSIRAMLIEKEKK